VVDVYRCSCVTGGVQSVHCLGWFILRWQPITLRAVGLHASVHMGSAGVSTKTLFVSRHGGDAGPVLVLLHGLGATGEVWNGLVDVVGDGWPGPVLVPDLPGHGRSAPLPRYSYGSLAAAIAAALEPDRPAAVLGHSLGGVLGLTLASGWFGVPVPAVCGLGMKVRWAPPELAKAAAIATRPAMTFDTQAQAMDRALRIAGLHGLTPELPSAVTSSPGGWRLTLDNAAFGVGAPDLWGLLAACRAKVVLAAGANDPMSPAEHLAEFGQPILLPACGHNAHLEKPQALQPILDQLLDATSS
jgi:pimeloyl-ACP methyl ester carboxylesterase